MTVSTKIIQNNSDSTQHANPLIEPLMRYHGKVVEVITFKPLPNNGKFNEIILRIVVFISIPLGYLALGFAALVGIAFNSCLSEKINSSHAANDSVQNTSKDTKPISHNKQTSAKAVAANVITVNAVAANAGILETRLSAIHKELLSYCPDTHLKAYYAANRKIKFGKTRTGSIYIETENRKQEPRHFDITPSGSGFRIDARYGSASFNTAPRDMLKDSDLSLINWAVSKIQNENSADSKTSADGASSFGKDGLSMRVRGHVIASRVQETPIADYNWKQAYTKKSSETDIQRAMPRMQEFVQQADNAVIAYKGTLSNFQRVQFVDPISKKIMPSAEHMFQMYKFSDNHPSRLSILQQTTPADALTAAKRHAFFLKDGVLKAWIACNLHLMVFIQLAKALEPSTGLKEDLIASKNDFIIEDTSSKRASQFPEKFWGDNGDGSGNNQLGYAQMMAREIVKDPSFSEQTAIYYYQTSVLPALKAYYKCIN
jgi:predicted NAD-dependent protein-ADP-ribosyltransferase YbiA (DUF1768 family)